MKLAIYELTIKHDSGVMRIKTSASSEQMAKKLIIDYENCPEESILSLDLVKTIY
jgi:hypothetical protein